MRKARSASEGKAIPRRESDDLRSTALRKVLHSPPTRRFAATSPTRGEVKNPSRTTNLITSPLVGEVAAKRRVGGLQNTFRNAVDRRSPRSGRRFPFEGQLFPRWRFGLVGKVLPHLDSNCGPLGLNRNRNFKTGDSGLYRTSSHYNHKKRNFKTHASGSFSTYQVC